MVSATSNSAIIIPSFHGAFDDEMMLVSVTAKRLLELTFTLQLRVLHTLYAISLTRAGSHGSWGIF